MPNELEDLCNVGDCDEKIKWYANIKGTNVFYCDKHHKEVISGTYDVFQYTRIKETSDA